MPSGPADVDANVSAVGPVQSFQPLPKRRDARLLFRSVRGRHDNAYPPQAFGLLRACR
jgi:hypothetical protein